jgi:hypothetical protein
VAYLIFTAMKAVKPVSWNKRPLQIALMLLTLFHAAYLYYKGSEVWHLAEHVYNGVPAAMMFLLATMRCSRASGI